jgi:hypothetical protein
VAIVHSLFANLYREPDVTKRRPLATIPFESRLEVVDPDADGDVWVRVRLPDATTAFIHRGSVTFDDRPLPVEEVTVLARQFVGLPYLWGGVSTFGFDCSGLTQMLCRRRNILIPRDAQPQANWEGMLAVTRDSLEPGDLLYFGPSSGRITHTGYYLGGGEFIHATTHIRPMVQISRLDEPHWSALLVACRRPRMEAPR